MPLEKQQEELFDRWTYVYYSGHGFLPYVKGSLMTTPIRAVIFDQGGVLSRGGGRGTNEIAASQAMGLDYIIEVPELLEALKRGQIDNAGFVDGVNALFPNAVKLTDAMWDEVYKTLIKEPLSYAFAEACRRSGRYTGLLSNINPAIATRLQEDGSYEDFYPLVLSCYVGYAKPDPEIYAIVEDQLREVLPNIQPQEILLLDDQDKCINGARLRGWQGLKVTSPERMVREAGVFLGLI